MELRDHLVIIIGRGGVKGPLSNHKVRDRNYYYKYICYQTLVLVASV